MTPAERIDQLRDELRAKSKGMTPAEADAYLKVQFSGVMEHYTGDPEPPPPDVRADV